jgi:hypothetical protein
LLAKQNRAAARDKRQIPLQLQLIMLTASSSISTTSDQTVNATLAIFQACQRKVN